MLDENQNIPANQAVAYIVMFLGVLLPATVYWQSGGIEFLGPHSVPKLILVTAGCGALGLAIFNGRRSWHRAILPGALAGAGASGLQIAYLLLLDRTIAYTGELMIVSLIGSAPGLVLFSLTRGSKTNDA